MREGWAGLGAVISKGMLFGLPGLASAALLTSPNPASRAIEKYQTLFAECQAPGSGGRLIVLRSFVQGGQPLLFAVDPETLTTRMLAAKGLRPHRLSWAKLRKTIADTPYGRAMADSEKSAAARQDAGIVHSLPPNKGVVLTIDLCPSLRPLDRSLFTAILTNFAPEEKPVPLGIAITGRWMVEHPADLAWLRKLDQDREIVVTWINHSFNHRYGPGLPLSQNFLLEPGTDLAFEVLRTEAAMIDNGLQPSVFFRFPGLVSDARLVDRVTSYGLIPVGSDAWLAKGQTPTSGSIVLVHGNGNEPIGIEKFLELVRSEGPAIREKHWLLFDLRESVSREEEKR
ncbi:MAG: polysaccharide deacetylase [Vicinamibacteria bacterium]